MEVLDHGYVKLIESWGSEERIIEAARMSTGKGFKGWGPRDIHAPNCNVFAEPGEVDCCCVPKQEPGDERLLAYLYRNHHMTPFEMAGATFEIQAPIFVLREWHRHRTQSYNELSARYTPLPDVNYVPSVERLMMDGGTNKQARGTGVQLQERAAHLVREHLAEYYSDIEEQYQLWLSWGVPKELARLVIPVGRYSRMRASANLRNWLQFMTLRCDSHAQWEIRQYANAVSSIVRSLFPRTWELWNDH